MWGFRSKQRNELEQLLKSSRQDFEFDRQNVRTRIMTAVNSRHLSKADLEKLTFRVKIWPRFALSGSVALVLLAGTTGFAYAAGQAAPGDLLFPVQKLQNQIVLSLPMPATKKEEIRTQIVATRLAQLSTVEQNPKADPAKLQALVEESQASIEDAVNNLPKPPADTNSQGKNNARFDALISQLEDLSSQHEQKIQALKQQTTDAAIQSQIDQSVTVINQNRAKLQRFRHTDQIQGADTELESGKNIGNVKNNGSNSTKTPPGLEKKQDNSQSGSGQPNQDTNTDD